MKTSERLDRLPPYLFAELERKISEKQAQGIDVISLGIGDPDTPSPGEVVGALAHAAADAGTHRPPRRGAGAGALSRMRRPTPVRTAPRRTAAARSSATRSPTSTSAASLCRS